MLRWVENGWMEFSVSTIDRRQKQVVLGRCPVDAITTPAVYQVPWRVETFG